MQYITNNAVVIVDGVEYPNNSLSVDPPDPPSIGSRLIVGLDRALDHLKFDRVNAYDGLLDRENGCLEYECSATQTNGHVMSFKLRFPSRGIHVIRTIRGEGVGGDKKL